MQLERSWQRLKLKYVASLVDWAIVSNSPLSPQSQEYQRLTEAAVQKMEPPNNQPSNPPTQDDADVCVVLCLDSVQLYILIVLLTGS